MKKTFRIGLLVFAIMCCLGISAFAASGVAETTVSTQSWKYTATFDAAAASTTITEGDMYLIIVIKTSALSTTTTNGFPTSLTADAILYIDQTTATTPDEASNSIVFSNFIPLNFSGGNVYITGGTLSAPTLLGTMQNHGILGDVNNSNNVDSTDARWILQRFVGTRIFDSTQLFLGDVNNSSNVDSTDARWILQRFVGIRDANYHTVG